MSGPPALERLRTGISGFDEALGGGLPRGRMVLVLGNPGAGKTIFALQTLAEGGYLSWDDIVDPWGRPYSYRVSPSAYEIGSRPPTDVGDEIVVRHPYSASQRMVLEGSPIDRPRTIRP